MASVELSESVREDRLGPFYRVYVEFVLQRVVHDLGNSVSGINSLSDYHLRAGIDDPAARSRRSVRSRRAVLTGLSR